MNIGFIGLGIMGRPRRPMILSNCTVACTLLES